METILAAAIAAVPSTLVAVSAFRKHSRAVADIGETKAAIGTPNGKGNVVQMLEAVLERQGEHDAEFHRVNARLSSLEIRSLGK